MSPWKHVMCAHPGSSNIVFIKKIYLYNSDPLKPHFYIVKLGFTGVYIIFLISDQNIDCGYSLEPPRWDGSNEYPQSVFWAEIWKNIRVFLSKNFQLLEVKFSIYLNRRVFVMLWKNVKKKHVAIQSYLELCRGGSNEYPQSMFLRRNKKNNVYPKNPSFII